MTLWWPTAGYCGYKSEVPIPLGKEIYLLNILIILTHSISIAFNLKINITNTNFVIITFIKVIF